MCVGPILAGFLYGTIGFFWLCAVLAFMFVFCMPFAYFYTGKSRKFIDRSQKIKPTITCTSLSIPSNHVFGTVSSSGLHQLPSRHCPPHTLFLNNSSHNNNSLSNHNNSAITNNSSIIF